MKSIKTYISICATALAAIVLSSCVENSSKYKQLQEERKAQAAARRAERQAAKLAEMQAKEQ